LGAFYALNLDGNKGGFAIIPNLFIEEVNAAIVKFHQQVTDKKAAILPTYNTLSDLVRSFFLQPTQPLSDPPST
jgi:hypothetical protein